MAFADKLKQLRLAAGLTQQQLADQSGIALGTIRGYEQGDREPLLSTALYMARALGVSVEALAEGLEEPALAPSAKPQKVRPKQPAADAPAATPAKGKGRQKRKGE